MAGKELLVFLSKSKAEAYVTELPIKNVYSELVKHDVLILKV